MIRITSTPFPNHGATPWRLCTISDIAHIGSWRNDDTTKLEASNGASGDLFGYSVAVDGERIVVGACYKQNFKGAAYVFERSGTAWPTEETDEFTGDDAAAGDYFGVSVAVSGDAILVGSPADDDEGDYAGAAFVFRYDSGNSEWGQEDKLKVDAWTGGEYGGCSVAISGDVAVLGAYEDNSGAGAVHVFQYDSASTLWPHKTAGKLFVK